MMHLHRPCFGLRIDIRLVSSPSIWTCLLVTCALFTIACVHLDHAFPFDLTQLYSTINKQHGSSIGVSSVQHYADQRLASQRRRRIKSTTTTTTSSTTVASSTLDLPISTSTTIAPAVTPVVLRISPSPPYALKELVKPKTSAKLSAPSKEAPGEAEPTVETILIQNYKQRKVTPFPKQTEVVIETRYGKVKGMTGDVMGKDVSAFLGVPYARAPVNSLRFRRTAKPKAWKDIIATQTFKPHCLQDFREDILLSRSLTTLLMSEDCLYVNIWAADVNSADLKPVLVWVYGGGFKGGTANTDETDGRVLAALGDIVVVTLNYRTGALGFVDLQSEEAPGNQGLYDILEALTFVKENIVKFGGDAARVTLVGQDSGAVTAGMLMTSPRAKGLFQRAILQSGSPLFQDYFEGKNLKSSGAFAHEIGCDSCVDLKEKLRCLRKKTIAEVLSAQRPLLVNDNHLFGPTFCEQLLPDTLLNTIENEANPFNVGEVLLGSNRDELSLSLVLDYPSMFSNRRINLNVTTLRDLRALILKIFSTRGNLHDESSIQYLVDFFFTGGDQNDTTENLIRRMYHVFGDAAIGCPVHIFAEQLVKKNIKVFLYEFNQRAQNMVWGSWMGVPIGTEVPYIFGHPLRYPRVYSKDDLAISKRLVATWSQFARNGTVPDQLDHKWEAFSDKKASFLEINPTEAVYGSRADNGVCNIFRIALNARNETSSDCLTRLNRIEDDIDLEQDLYDTTTADPGTEETEGSASTQASTEPPLDACPLFQDDPDGPSIDYYNYQVVDLKVVTVVGAKAVFNCEPEQALIGEQISTCAAGGTWTSSRPICQTTAPGHSRNTSLVPLFACDFFAEPLGDQRLRVDYENLHEINETVKYAVKGSLARFKCFPMNAVDRVRLAGQEVAECSKYGIWSSIEPSCETVAPTRQFFKRDFKNQFFLIGLILVITFALMFVSYLLYSKMSVKEYSEQDYESDRRRRVLDARRSLGRLPSAVIDARREERELLQVDQEFYLQEGSEMSPEDLEVISILSKARYGPPQKRELLDRNMNIIRSGTADEEDGDSSDEESGSSPETVLRVLVVHPDV